MDVGATLRLARMRKRLTLEQLARTTKISVPTLNALENNDVDRLPAKFYTRGFLRTYAREVGLDPEQTVHDYLHQFAVPASGAPGTTHERDRGVAAHAPSTAASHATWRTAIAQALPLFALVATGVVVGIAAYVLFSRGEDAANTKEAASDATPEVVSAPSAPAPDAARGANLAADALHVELRATGPCWISATADRNAPMSALLQVGDSRVVEAKNELVLRVGDPATLSMVINGRPAGSLGRAAQPVTVQINKDNFREFLKQ